MKITLIDTYCFSSNYGNGRVFGQPKSVKSITIIKICTKYENYFGIGETYSGVYAPELVKPIVNYLSKFLINKEIEDRELFLKIRLIPFISSNGIIKSILSALEIAQLDLIGKIEKKPIFNLLNASLSNIRKVDVYYSGGSVNFNEQEIKKDIKQAFSRGFNAYKMRVGLKSIKQDIQRVKIARETLGDNNSLMVDAIMGTHNKKWNVKKSLEFLKLTKKFKLTWLEEPLKPDNFHEYELLKSKTKVPIAFGESFTNFEDFKNSIIINCSNILQPDVTHCGFRDAKQLVEFTKEKKIKLSMHVWGSPISFLANMHFAIAHKKIDYLEIPSVKLDFLNEIYLKEIKIENGKLTYLSKTNGLGIEFDPAKLKRYKFIEGSGFSIK